MSITLALGLCKFLRSGPRTTNNAQDKLSDLMFPELVSVKGHEPKTPAGNKIH